MRPAVCQIQIVPIRKPLTQDGCVVEIGDEVGWDLPAFTQELREFREDDKHAHDDQVDALSMFWQLTPTRDDLFGAIPQGGWKPPNRVT